MDIDIGQLIWAIINFLILLAILYKFLWNPILKTFDKRREEINENLSSAESSKKEAEEMLKEYKEMVNKANEEAQEIINRSNKNAEARKNEIINEAREEATKISEKAQADIGREKEKAMKEVREEIATLAVMAAGKVLEKNITREDHDKMIEEFLSEVGEVQ